MVEKPRPKPWPPSKKCAYGFSNDLFSTFNNEREAYNQKMPEMRLAGKSGDRYNV
jgi:hypothetical protein